MEPSRLRYVIGCGIVAVAGTWAIVSILSFLARTEPLLTGRFSITPVSSSRLVNTSTDAIYAGSEACIACHSEEAATYRQTAHSLALADVDPAGEPVGGVFFHQASGREYQVFEHEGKIHHRETLRAADGAALANVEFPVHFLIGSGRHTRSYLVEDRGFWAASSWDPSFQGVPVWLEISRIAMPRGPADQPDRYDVRGASSAAFTIARMPTFTASLRSGHRSMMACRSGSMGAFSCSNAAPC